MTRKKTTRTTGAKSQWEFDNILSDLKDDELEFMSQKYSRDLLYYRTHNNMNSQLCQKEYLEMQQRKKMIDEEIQNRRLIKSNISSQEIRFNSEECAVINSDNSVLELLAYNQDETEIINLPSGTKGKNKKEEWTPKQDNDDEEEYSVMDDVELSWEQWIIKNKLNEPINN